MIAAIVLMIVVNALANALPINGQNTGEISDRFDVYFTPAGYVFSIWGLIYLGLIAYAVYQALPAQRENPRLRRIGWWVVIGSLANTAWIFLWHYEVFPLTLPVMLVLLLTLIVIYLSLGINRVKVSTAERLAVHVPFSIYLGWITVATVANITAFLVRIGWNRFGLSQELWMIIISLLAAVIGFAATVKRKDLAYGLVLVFAYIGILAKRLSAVGLVSGSGVITAVIVSLVILTIGVIYTAVAMVQGRGRLAAVKQ